METIGWYSCWIGLYNKSENIMFIIVIFKWMKSVFNNYYWFFVARMPMFEQFINYSAQAYIIPILSDILSYWFPNIVIQLKVAKKDEIKTTLKYK